MQRRVAIENKVSHERWLVSYSDFVTLLFAFFVVMYSVSQVNESKYRELSNTLSVAFSQSPPSEPTALPAQGEPIETLESAIEQVLKDSQLTASISLGGNEQWLELTLDSELLFASGSDQVNAAAEQIFFNLAEVLGPSATEIQIIGHTDNVPISNEKFASNWELSSARALRIVNALSQNGIAPQRLSAVAFGEYQPIADNATEEGRRKNRRVVLRVAQMPETEVAPKPREIEVNGTDALPVLADKQKDNSEAESVPAGIKPVKLKGGDLLFSSDPDLPRLRQREEED